MNTQAALTEITANIKAQVLAGVTPKNVRRSLEAKNMPSILIDKLMRIVEIEIKHGVA